MIGKKYGRWTVLEGKKGVPKWLCRCECGTERLVSNKGLRYGKSQSCGCLISEVCAKRNYRHGLTHSREYAIWSKMKDRCSNKNNKDYRLYGERGVLVEWKSFKEFISDMGPRPSSKHSIDRIDTNGNYSKENCRWATPKEQANNSRHNTIITYKNKNYTIAQAAELIGINYETFRSRLTDSGWSVEKAMTTPVIKRLPRPKIPHNL